MSNSITNLQRDSLWKRFRRNFMAYGYSQVVTLAVQFLTVPFFLHYWGKERYAEWLVLSGIPIMLGLLDFGVAQATASKATLLASRNDIPAVRRSLQTGMVFSLLVALTIVALIWLAGFWIDWPNLLRLPSLSHAQAQTVLLLLSGHLGTNLLGGPLNAWFIAMDRTATGFFLLANRRMLDVLVTIAALTLGADSPHLAAAMLSGQILFLALVALYAAKETPWPVIGLQDASLGEFRSILKPGLAHAGMTIGQALMLQAGLQFLNQVAPASVVVLYSMGRTLMRLILQIGVVAERAARPELSRLKGAGNDAAAQDFQKRIFTVTLIVAILSYAMLVVLGPSIMIVWSTGDVLASKWELAALGLHALLYAAWMVPASTLMATNQHGKVASFYVAGCAIGILLIAMTPSYGNTLAIVSLTLCVPEIFAIAAMTVSRNAVQVRKE